MQTASCHINKVLILLALLLVTVSYSLTVRVGIYNNSPLVYLENGKPRGLYIEVIERVASREGWQIEYIFDTWSNLITALKSGQIDVLTAIAYSQERAELFDYNSEEVLLNWGVVCVKDEAQIENTFDLDGKDIAVISNDIYYEGFRNLCESFGVNVSYVFVDDYFSALKAVQEEEVFAGVVSKNYALINCFEYHIKLTQIMFSPVALKFAFPKGAELNTVLIPAIDRYLAELKSHDDSYEALINNYFGYFRMKTAFPKWLFALLIAMFAALGTFFIWTRSLRVVVNVKTKELQNVLSIAEMQKKELNKSYQRADLYLNRFTKISDLLGNLISVSSNERSFLESIINALKFLLPGMDIYCVAFGCFEKGFALVYDRDTLREIPMGKHDFLFAKEGLYRDSEVPNEITALLKTKLSEAYIAPIADKEVNNCYLLVATADKNQRRLTKEEISILRTIVGITKIFAKMTRHERSTRDFHRKLIMTLLKILEYHEPCTKGHSERVADYSVRIAKRLGLSDETVEKIYWSALMHDIGKVAVSKEILNKKQRLSEEDYEKIKQHPVVASELLEGYAGLTEYAKIIRHHHERWDGKGYPDGLKGEEIPLESRIMAVADAFDAMTSDRPYRKALSVEVAKDQLIRGSKTQFDDRLVRIMISIIEEDLQAEGFSSG